MKEDINKLSRAEFISFLYSERDREISNKYMPGWSNWVLIGATFSFLTITYKLLKSNAFKVQESVFILLLSGFLAAVLSYYPIFKWLLRLISRKRSIDYSKLCTLKEAAPTTMIVFGTIISIVMALVLYKYELPSTLVILWLILFIIKIITIVDLIVHRNNLVLAIEKIDGFRNSTIEAVFSVVNLLIAAIISNLSFRHIKTLNFTSFPSISLEFEIAICIVFLLILLFLMIYFNESKNNKAEKNIDFIIDRYNYGNLSQEDAYTELLILRHGKDSIQALEYEQKKLSDAISVLEKRQSDIEKIDYSKKSTEDVDRALDIIDNIRKDCERYIIVIKSFLNKMREILDLRIPINESEYKTLFDKIESSRELVESLTEKCSHSITIIKTIVENKKKLICRYRGGLCENLECQDRNKRRTIMHSVLLFLRKIKLKPHIISNRVRMKCNLRK